MTKLPLILAQVVAPLGAPLLPQELAPDPVMDVQLGLIEYFRYLPIRVGTSYVITNAWDRVIPYTDIFAAASPDPAVQAQLFYVGVVHHAMRSQIGQNAFNQNLLGLNVGVPIADPMQNLQMATMLDISTGDTYYEEDDILQQVRFTFGGSGNFSVVWGVGSTNPEHILTRHIQLAAMLVGDVYYRRLLAIRKTGSFTNTDFKIDVGQLEATIADNRKRADEYLENAGYTALTVG